MATGSVDLRERGLVGVRASHRNAVEPRLRLGQDASSGQPRENAPMSQGPASPGDVSNGHTGWTEEDDARLAYEAHPDWHPAFFVDVPNGCGHAAA